LDDLRPSLNVNQPRPGQNANAVSEIRFGAGDTYTGVDASTFSITSDLAINGRNPGDELFDLAQSVAPGVYSIAVSPPITQAQNAHIFAEVKDIQGNVARVKEEFSVGAPLFLFRDDFEDGDASDWTYSKGTWSVLNGSLTGTHDRKADAIAPFVGCTNCIVEADLQFETAGGKISLLAWFQDKKNYFEVVLKEDKDKILLLRKENGIRTLKLKAELTIGPGTNYRVRVTNNSGVLSVLVNGTQLLSGNVSDSPFGTVGFRIKTTSASFKEITVY
ncbi:MAG TPA: hypothetical protein VLH08_01720, partial [Acidobacteriota bacterium]|nr:hypothetical protein [Acidobacteriota bacterium]